ncbi:MAG: glycosyltransferase [Limimaricola sp.]|uniref:ceramide glucosyltransferase n=1 Tax=Limimaricola sp. TaxID=2211665 RepID=UPI001D27929E|nr:ceramide glucosyltransferase [Limimaricola sp.]MBI1415856.1 glycosyltransferase [Limimaricola sp.]
MQAEFWIAAFVIVAFVIQTITVGTVWMRLGRRAPKGGIAGRPPVSVLRPVRGIENHIEETLASTFTPAYPDYEILFCCADADDPIVPVVERLIAAHPQVDARLLIGDERPSGNPKLNNLVKGWYAAKYDWILMADSNVLLPPDYLDQLLGHWTPGTGLVSSPPAGIRPEGFWAALEAAFLNTYQDRMQLMSDSMGNGFAQGKMLFWRRDILEDAGGLVKLGQEMAEDVASTKAVRGRGLKVRLLTAPLPQPLGRRNWAEVWNRQVRWARVRRLGFLGLFMAEIASGGFFPMLGLALLGATGVLSWPMAALGALAWYGAEWLLARRASWPAGPADIAAWLLRDALIPALWVSAWAGSGFEWRGNKMTVAQIPGQDGKGRG